MNKMTILNVGYGKVTLLKEYYKGSMSSRLFYGSIELEKSGKYFIRNISLDSRQNLSGTIRNNFLMLKRADAIFIPYLFTTPFFILALLKHLKLYNKKIIAICHTTLKQGHGFFNKLIYKMIYDAIDVIFFHSQKNLEESIHNKSIRLSNARFLYWGDDLDYIDRTYTISDKGDYFISTGQEQRDYMSLISAFEKCKIPLKLYYTKGNKHNNYDVYFEHIENKYDNIQIHYVDRTNASTTLLAKQVSGCLCVVIPINKNVNYCVGLTSIVEAMAMGKPVVSTYNPYSPIDIEKEGIGLVVDENRTWEEAIQYIYTHKEEARKMGMRGRELAEELYNIKRCAAQIEEAINEK